MRLLLITLLLVLFTGSMARATLGIGLVTIDFDENTKLKLYENPSDDKAVKVIEFFKDESIGGYNIRNLDELSAWLKPESIWLDYSSFVFRCQSQNDDWYQVIADNSTGKTYWIRKSGFTKFLGWETYLKNMFGIERLATEHQKLRKRPDDLSEEIPYEGEDCFQSGSMKGEWIEIFSPEYCQDGYTDSETVIESAWIRWRKGDKLLIRYFITS